jgi:hypothetical protein
MKRSILKAHDLDASSVDYELNFRAQVSARSSPTNDRKAESMNGNADCAPSTRRVGAKKVWTKRIRISNHITIHM